MAFKLSKYQENILEWVKTGTGSAVVEAVAGSGKSSTLELITNIIPPGDSVIMLAFNKSIVESLKARIRKGIDIKTLNGYGHTLVGKRFNWKVKIDKNKTFKIIDDISNEFSQRGGYIYDTYRDEIVKLVSLSKANAIAPDQEHDIKELIDVNGMSVNKKDKCDVSKMVGRILLESIQNTRTIDFDDQLYLPVMLGMQGQTYDWVLCDEAQDFSPVQHELTKKLIGPDTRVIAVGDTYQSIYAFRGASHTSMLDFKSMLNATVMPLSICYRCGKEIVKFAKNYMPTIEYWDDQVDGDVYDQERYDSELFPPGSMILCRMNAPLVKTFYRLIGANVPAKIPGRDIAAGLKKILRSFGDQHTRGDIEEKITAWQDEESQAAIKADQEKRLELITDKADVLRVILEESGLESIDGMISHIDQLFDPKRKGSIILSTIHKAKGSEADNVFILDDFLMPSSMAKTEEALVQERNLQYVAYTRAKQNLVFIESDGWAEGATMQEQLDL